MLVTDYNTQKNEIATEMHNQMIENTQRIRQHLHDDASYEYGDFSIRFHQRDAAFTRNCFSSFINGS